MGGNDDNIDKSSARVSQLFNKFWIFRYLSPHKVVFYNGYEFKQYFSPLLKDFDIKYVLTIIKNPQANAPVYQLHQLILNMLVTNDYSTNLFDYIAPWGETLAPISWVIRDFLSFHYSGQTMTSCLWKRHDIQHRVIPNHWETATSGYW